MNMEILLSIIIPCKNEEKYIGKLLDCLTKQQLPQSVEIIIADAESTDNTLQIINSYTNLLPNLTVIKGGLPPVGRNLGAHNAKGKTLLFIDSDVYFNNNNLILKSLEVFNQKKAHLLGCLLNIENNPKVKTIYKFCNLTFYLSKYDKPFVVGSYMMIDKETFFNIGGFDEELMHCEDYFLSKEVNPNKYVILNEYIYTDDRRFKKLGNWGIIKYFVKNMIEKNNKDYFKRDIGYWL